MEELRPGTDPRLALPRHRERGPKEYRYTYLDVASAGGYSPLTVRGSRLLSTGLRSLSAWIRKGLLKKAAPVTDEEFAARIGHQWIDRWRARWPRFEIWHCADPDCDRFVLGTRSFCLAHGGWASDEFSGGHFMVHRIPLHRIIAGDPPGMEVHHVDFNRWNNRSENLQTVTPDEHRAIHVASGQFFGREAP